MVGTAGAGSPKPPGSHPASSVIWGISPRTHTFGPEGTMEYLQVDDSFPEYQLGKTLPVIFKHPPLPGDAWEVKGDATAMVSFLQALAVHSTSSIPELPISFPPAPSAMPQQHQSCTSLSSLVTIPGGI